MLVTLDVNDLLQRMINLPLETRLQKLAGDSSQVDVINKAVQGKNNSDVFRGFSHTEELSVSRLVSASPRD